MYKSSLIADQYGLWLAQTAAVYIFGVKSMQTSTSKRTSSSREDQFEDVTLADTDAFF
jgi:hypothetical protein